MERWKNAVLQMLETCFSKERLLSKSTPRFLIDDEEFTEQPSSIRQWSRILHAKVFGPIINTSVSSKFTFTFTFNHLADAFIQSDVQMRRTIEAIRPSREQQYTSAMTSLS